MSGETAPLLFTSLNNQFWSLDMNAPMANLPVVIFQFALIPVRRLEGPRVGRRVPDHDDRARDQHPRADDVPSVRRSLNV